MEPVGWDGQVALVRKCADTSTHLSVSGVRPRTAMAAIRHSRIELTMDYYTDPVLLDITITMAALPDFATGDSQSTSRTATGA